MKMINRGATLVSRLAVIFMVLFTFTACGGGGGGGDAFFQGGDDDDDEGSFSFVLLDPQGNPTNSVTASSPGTLRVSVKNGGANILVSADTTIGTLLPATGTALTDNSGVATFQLQAGAEQGAGSVTTTATVDDETVTGTFNFQVGESGLRLGYFDEDGTFIENAIFIEPNATLSAGGNAQFTVVALDSSGNRVSTAEEVRFNSGCIAAGLATIVPAIPRTVNGQASTLYTATGCTGTDQITASLVGASAQAFGTINVASRETNAVNFVSAAPLLIVLRGTGGLNRDETSDVVFQVVDGNGLPLPGVTVSFSLTTDVGGLSLSKTSTLSDGNGNAAVTVQAGDVATVARVVASVNDGSGQEVTTVSDLITVTTGLPDKNSISLAVGECDGEGSFVVDGAWTTDLLCRTLTVSMADKFNNPVVDGTAAVFTTEYGSIISTCTTVNGVCSVEWRSQEPRVPTITGDDYIVSVFDNQGTDCPSHNGSNAIPCPDDLGEIRGGRSAILVHAIGEESFIDANANGIYDQGELFQNIPEASLDSNEDGVYSPALPQCQSAPTGSLQCISGQEEIFVDFNSNGKYDLNDDPAVYNGLLCPVEGDGVWCSRTLLNVSDSAVVTLGDAPNYFFVLVNGAGSILVSGDNAVVQGGPVPLNTDLKLYISDTYNNPPPGGATISLSAEGACEVLTTTSTGIFNQSSSGAYSLRPVAVGPKSSNQPPKLTITLTTPVVTQSWTMACDAVEDPCAGDDPPDDCP
jgi:hypothetical protein